MMRSAFTATIFLVVALPSLAAADAEKSTKVLVLGHAKDSHPRQTHEYIPVCKLLAKCLEQTPRVKALVSEGWPANQEEIEGIAAIVLYLPWGANELFDGPQRPTVTKLLAEGVGLSAIHWSTGAQGADYGQLWLDQLGEWFHTDFSTIPHVEGHWQLVDSADPICRGVRDFNMFDEYYFNCRFAPGVRPLAHVSFEGKPQTVAWSFERPQSNNGRSFGCVAGHYQKNFGNDLFRRFLVNGILWTAHLDIPDEGAPCKISADDLELPPAQATPK